MKKIFCMIFLIMLLMLCSCGGISGTSIEAASDVVLSTDDWVTLEIDQASVTQTSCDVTIKVNCDYEISGGEPEAFAVEKYVDGKWYKLKYLHPNDASPAVAYAYEGTQTVTADWSRHYGTLDGGHYRLVKYLWATTEIDEEAGETTDVDFCVACEFDVA